jgi:nucleoside-diphosphate-sugar epimerase
MSTKRRDFLKATAGALGLGLLPRGVRASELGDIGRRSVAPLRILILGGTGFTGPHQVRYAVSRGHKITVFNRGRRQAELPPEVEHLQGDRNGQLDALKGKSWDVVIDNPTTLPKWVRDVGPILEDNAGHYIFISTISVYAPFKGPGADETSPVLPYKGADAFAEARITGELYGPLKAISEQEAERWFPGKTTVIRPGLIVGPGDESDRFTYWPVRIDRGGEILAPGDGSDPVQIIDARDLAEWTIRMAEQKAPGVYNATGPSTPYTMKAELEGIREAIAKGKDARLTWVPTDFLTSQQVAPWMEMPTWVPNAGDERGFSEVSVARAAAKGLTYRPLATTARDTLAWFKTLPAERQGKLRAGIAPEKEKAVLDAWRAKKG